MVFNKIMEDIFVCGLGVVVIYNIAFFPYQLDQKLTNLRVQLSSLGDQVDDILGELKHGKTTEESTSTRASNILGDGASRARSSD